MIKAGQPLVQIFLRDKYDLGSEFFRWEMATSVACWKLRINPFDQPNVESAKELSRQMMATFLKEGKLPEWKPTMKSDGIAVYTDLSANSPEAALKKFLAQYPSGKNGESGKSYLSLQAYINPSPETDRALQSLRTRIQQAHFCTAITLGYGPRFLHSTGQLHKGDGGHGLFIQFTSDIEGDASIPDEVGKAGSTISFGVLKKEQLMGDRQALLKSGRKVITFDLGANVICSLEKLSAALS